MKKIFIALFVAAAAGCGRSDIMTYDGAEYIQFSRSFADSVSFSFIAAGGSDTHDYPVGVELVGQQASHDRTFKVEVVTDYTPAPAEYYVVAPTESYAMPTEFTLKAGEFAATFNVRLKKLPAMEGKTARLVLRLAPTGDFRVGETQRSLFVLRFTDAVTKPAWWTTVVQNSYLGVYSDKKFRLFVEVTDQFDLANDPYTMRLYTLQFKQYLRNEQEGGRTVYEADGTTPMTVAVIGG